MVGIVFLALTVLQGLMVLSVAIATLYYELPAVTVPVEYSILAVFVSICFGVYTWLFIWLRNHSFSPAVSFSFEAIYAENVFQFFAAVLVSVMMLAFSVINMSQTNNLGSVYSMWSDIIVVANSVFTVTYFALVIPVR